MVRIIRPADMHVHFRQDAVTASLVAAHVEAGFDTVLAMPNTSPPVAKVTESDPGDARSLEGYRSFLLREGADAFRTLLVPLYLTAATTPRMLSDGVRAGLLSCVKYYPPHGTTNSAHGVPMSGLIGGDVLRAMEDEGVVLCVHGERHGVTGDAWLGRHSNAEETFYREEMTRLRDAHPRLRISCEHVTTKVAVDYVNGGDHGATVTPMHLTYRLADLVQNWWGHLKCMPVVKFDEDVAALRAAVTDPDNRRFYAGTDSAPHPKVAKSSDCGCASGCFTGAVSVPMYAQAFEAAGCAPDTPDGRKAFETFMSVNGPAFHGVPQGRGELTLERGETRVGVLETPVGDVVPLPVGIVPDGLDRSAVLPWRISR